MKALVISATFPPVRSGGADFALRLCQHLARAGCEVDVATSRIRGVARDPAVRVHPIMDRWAWREWPRLARLARHCRPDVINLHFVGHVYHDEPMVTFAPFLLKKLLPGVRMVTHIENAYGIRFTPQRPAGRAARKLLELSAGISKRDFEFGTILRSSDRVIVLSDAHRLALEDHLPGVSTKTLLLPPPPIIVMSQGEDGSARKHGREMLGVRPDALLLAYFGYIYPGKGIETLLESFTLLQRPPERDLKLVLIGGASHFGGAEPYLEQLQSRAQALGIARDLIWTGYYDTGSEQASLWLRAADVCVLPFDQGVFLNNSSFAAAAAHALPIVTTRGEVTEPAFEDGENLMLAPPQEPRALAKAIQSLLDDPEKRQKLGQGAAKMAARWFNWDENIKRTLEVFG